MLGRVDSLSQSEIAQLDLSFKVHKDIGAFKVSVYDLFGVQVLKGLQDLPHDTFKMGQLECRHALDDPSEIVFHVLEDQDC